MKAVPGILPTLLEMICFFSTPTIDVEPFKLHLRRFGFLQGLALCVLHHRHNHLKGLQIRPHDLHPVPRPELVPQAQRGQARFIAA